MTTQYEEARRGRITPAMKHCARSENVSPEKVRAEVACGHAVIPANPAHTSLIPGVVGRAFRTKINANIGRSTEKSSSREEVRKMNVALNAGAECMMDLSVGCGLGVLRRTLLKHCPVPFGTVPIYEAMSRTGGKPGDLTRELLVDVIRGQAGQGVDFMTIHAGLLREHVGLAMKRKMGIVSRGGAIIAEWMSMKQKQNPFFEAWDEIMEICHRHDVTVSLGDGLRPGCVADASDRAQFAELAVLGKLVKRCRKSGVQVMVEGPGHVPFNQIKMNMDRQRKICGGAPFYVLGPVVTDIAPGYDHITSAIGGTAAAFYGASLLCYVTPAEHLGLPDEKEVREGVVASLIAAHAADVARGLPGAIDRDNRMSEARACFNWKEQFKLALDGKTAGERFQKGRSGHGKADHCSMCGKEFCAIRTSRRVGELHHGKSAKEG